ncbi:unnamed protein product [Schistosoma spindalis]|nr:unnamed protein product [Schistosoma spindale]
MCITNNIIHSTEQITPNSKSISTFPIVSSNKDKMMNHFTHSLVNLTQTHQHHIIHQLKHQTSNIKLQSESLHTHVHNASYSHSNLDQFNHSHSESSELSWCYSNHSQLTVIASYSISSNSSHFIH